MFQRLEHDQHDLKQQIWFKIIKISIIFFCKDFDQINHLNFFIMKISLSLTVKTL
jgi:hypothetical protein